MKRLGIWAFALLCLAIVHSSVFAGDPELYLKRSGLVLEGSTWVTRYEREMDPEVLEVRQAYAELRRAQAKARTFDLKTRRVRLQIAEWEREMDTVHDKLAGQKYSERLFEQAAAKQNELSKKISAAEAKYLEPESQIESEMMSKRGQYGNRMVNVKNSFEWAERRYAQLAKDNAVTKAIKAYNQANQTEHKLGPTPHFERQFKVLKNLYDKCKAERIDMEVINEMNWTDVNINSQKTSKMVVDIFKPYVSLPAAWIEGQGIEVTETHQRVNFKTTDGKTIQASLVKLKSVQIGSFFAKDVEAVILPPELTTEPPRIGLSYFKNFSAGVSTGKKPFLMLVEKK